MKITFFGAYDPAYPRNSVIRKGLRSNGVGVTECRAPMNLKFWARYPSLFFRRHGRSDYLFVPEFCQKDMPLAALLGRLSAAKVIFDPLAARFETKIIDWGWKPADSPAAWWNARIDRAAFASAGLILADTAAHKNYYCENYGVSPDKIEVLPIGYDDDLFKPRGNAAGPAAAARAERFEVLFFGSFLPLHGADVIAEAAGIVAAKDPSVRFTFIGAGRTFDAVRAKAAGLKNIEFLGRRPARELPGLIDAADICLGIFGRTDKARRVVPHKVFQSLGMRKALITARTPAAEEFFAHKRDLFFCDEPMAESLAAAVIMLKSDAALRERVAAGGYALIKESYTPKAIGRRLLEIILRRFG